MYLFSTFGSLLLRITIGTLEFAYPNLHIVNDFTRYCFKAKTVLDVIEELIIVSHWRVTYNDQKINNVHFKAIIKIYTGLD